MKSKMATLMTMVFVASASISHAQAPLFPQIAETTKAAPETARFFNDFFTAKSRHDVDATMSFFSRDLLTYTDAILGWPFDDFDSLKGVFSQYMPNWGQGRSYPVRIIGGPSSAVVAFVDTPELFGGEIRLLGAVDLEGGKIVRWVDYWDSTGFPTDVYEKVRTPAEKFPTDMKDTSPAANADPGIVRVATGMQKDLTAGNAKLAAARLSYDVVYEDLALRTQVLGRDAASRYLDRIAATVPYGRGASLMHVVGGSKGGGFEWRSADGAVRGLTAIELDDAGLISRITTVYDGRLLADAARKSLIALSAER